MQNKLGIKFTHNVRRHTFTGSYLHQQFLIEAIHAVV